MMKKILLLGSALFALNFVTSAQGKSTQLTVTKSQGHFTSEGNPNFKTAVTNTLFVKDTLHYYLNKFYFKTATTDYTNFPFHVSAASTSTNITHVGSRFDVPVGDSITVTGLEAFAQRVTPAVNLQIPIHIYLCKLNAQGVPILPGIDSVVSIVSGNQVNAIGGNLFNGPKVLKESFAILFRNMSTSSGDYARLLRTSGTTATNTTSNPSTKCSDYENGKDYGYVRFNGNFYSTRDFTLAAGFGVGTAYEFVVAPRVEYYVQASQQVPSWIRVEGDTIAPDFVCARDPMTFTNTSSGFFEHRMYNLNQFYRKWNLYSPFPSVFSSAFSSDSSITWHFDFYDNADHTDSRMFLPYVNNHTITALTDVAIEPFCFEANQFRARLKPMGALGRVPQYVFNENFKVCLMWCNGDTVGVAKLKNYDNLKVYPNPAINGKSLITGLKGENTINAYNMLGQLILTEKTTSANFEINLSKQPSGTYLIKIVNSDNQAKMLKIITQD